MVKCKHCGGEILAQCNADVTMGIDEWDTQDERDVREVLKSWTLFYVCSDCGEISHDLVDLKEID